MKYAVGVTAICLMVLPHSNKLMVQANDHNLPSSKPSCPIYSPKHELPRKVMVSQAESNLFFHTFLLADQQAQALLSSTNEDQEFWE